MAAKLSSNERRSARMLRCWICHGDDPGLIRVWRGAEVSVLRANRKQNLLHHAHAVDGPVAEDGFAVDVAAADGAEVAAVAGGAAMVAKQVVGAARDHGFRYRAVVGKIH